MQQARRSAAASDGTVGKALEVLDLVAMQPRPVRFSDLLAQSPLPKATLYRLLQVLTNQGMLSFDADSHAYAPGVRLVRLAHAAWRHSSLAPIAAPHLDRLAADLGQTIHLAQLDDGQVLYVDKRNASERMEMFSQAGKVGPAHCTGVGKAMLAHLPEADLNRAIARQSFHRFTATTLVTPAALRAELAAIRVRGHAFDAEEHEPGIICVAVPVLTGAGRLLGGLSVTSTTRRTTLAELGALAPRLAQVAGQIGREADSWRFPEQTTSERVGETCPG